GKSQSEIGKRGIDTLESKKVNYVSFFRRLGNCRIICRKDSRRNNEVISRVRPVKHRPRANQAFVVFFNNTHKSWRRQEKGGISYSIILPDSRDNPGNLLSYGACRSDKIVMKKRKGQMASATCLDITAQAIHSLERSCFCPHKGHAPI